MNYCRSLKEHCKIECPSCKWDYSRAIGGGTGEILGGGGAKTKVMYLTSQYCRD